jgi:hypothetical protein
VTGTDTTGTFASWSADAALSDGRPAVRDWAGTSPGRVYSGAPNGGRYVPLDTVGLNYTSPGHQGQTTSTTSTTATTSTTTTAPPVTAPPVTAPPVTPCTQVIMSGISVGLCDPPVSHIR